MKKERKKNVYPNKQEGKEEQCASFINLLSQQELRRAVGV